LALLFYPAIEWLIRSWLSNPYYTHGFLVPAIAAFFAWRQWRHLTAEPRQGGSVAGLILALAGLAVAIWAMRWHNYFVASLALIGLVIGLLLYLEGWLRLRHWLFPLLFLILMVPLPFIDQAGPWLEAFSARWASVLARLGGIAVVQQGGEITLPNSTFVVGAPCSGLRSLVTMITIGIGWVYLVEGPWWGKTLMVLAIIPLVAFSNVLRIALLLVVAAFFGEEAAMSYYHDWSSPILFILSIGFLLLLGKVVGCSRVRDDIF
jgi:exosortase